MIKVALTGNIGAGKTTVSKMFEALGVPVFNSDLSAREAEKNPEVITNFKNILGEEIFSDGVLDRVKMREIVFTNKAKLNEINQLVVPYVSKSFDNFVKQNRRSPYVMLESAILFEINSHNNFDYVITVSANLDVRRERVLKRDGITEIEFTNKVNNQLSNEFKEKHSDFIIHNNGILKFSARELNGQVKDVHNDLQLLCVIRNGETNY